MTIKIQWIDYGVILPVLLLALISIATFILNNLFD